jgi:hypothetical protein
MLPTNFNPELARGKDVPLRNAVLASNIVKRCIFSTPRLAADLLSGRHDSTHYVISQRPSMRRVLVRCHGQETHWAQTLQESATRLREQSYSAAVIDQFLIETEPEERDQMIGHLGTTFPVYVNFGVTGMERLVREVRSALHRRRGEEGAARRAVAAQMHREMSETLTAMLLSCELAMSVPNVPIPRRRRFARSTISRANCGSG